MDDNKTRLFIREHINDNVDMLALKNVPSDIDKTFVINQIAARQRLKGKIPSWAENEDLVFPQKISLEQCSSETTAKYKADIIADDFSSKEMTNFADLTGGFGVDCSFLSKLFHKSYYIETQSYLCEIAEHNFKILNDNIEVANASAYDFLQNTDKHFDLIFIDPARRDKIGRKMVSLHDCSPDIIDLQDIIFNKTNNILLKASPMLDIDSALRELHHVKEIHVIAIKNECKELLFLMEKNFCGEQVFKCIDIPSMNKPFIFNKNEEKECELSLADEIGSFIYEPSSALLKSGCFKLAAKRFNLKKLHINSHLYTSEKQNANFAGRVLNVKKILHFDNKSCREIENEIQKCNIMTRNFPLSSEELRKKLKIKDGGNIFVIGTTCKNNEKKLIVAEIPNH